MFTISPILAQCDWNEDGTLNVIDVVETVDCILNDCFSEDIYGCTDPEAINYNPNANIDDGSCEYDIPPVEEYFSFNQSQGQAFYFFVIATIDGVGLEEGDWIGAFNGDVCVGSRPWYGSLTDVPLMGDDGTIETSGYLLDGDIPGFIIYDASSNAYLNATSIPEVQWSNFLNIFIDELVASSNQNDVLGCTDFEALNYNPEATEDDGSCEYPELITDMVLIPAGEYTAGQWDAIIPIDYDFEIMKYEVTNEQYLDYLSEAYETGDIWITGGGYLRGNYDGQEEIFYHMQTPIIGDIIGKIFWNGWYFDINSEEFLEHPVTNITWYGAVAFADHYDMRLPANGEWEKSSRGTTGNDFPWGNELPTCDLCNFDWCINGTMVVGEYGNSNPFNIYDLAGNVMEWTDNEFCFAKGGSWKSNNNANLMFTWHNYEAGCSDLNNLNDKGFRLVRDVD